VTEKAATVATRIADELASCGVKLVASLPDNWLMDVIKTIEHDDRFTHVPVNREESAIGLCSGAYMGAMGSAALMGASGFMTVIYAITKINYTYEIPLFLLLTLRGGVGDHAPVAEQDPATRARGRELRVVRGNDHRLSPLGPAAQLGGLTPVVELVLDAAQVPRICTVGDPSSTTISSAT